MNEASWKAVGTNLLAGKSGELGKETFSKAFGKFAPLRLFFAGAASSGVGDVLDLGFSKIVKDDGAGFLMNYAIWTQAFFKDGSKTGLMYLIPEYSNYKEGKFWGPVFKNGGRNIGLQYLFSILGSSL